MNKGFESKNTLELTRMREALISGLELSTASGIADVNGLALAIEKIDNILNERANTLCEMREFTPANWRAYPGCEKFPDGSEPLIGKCDCLEIVVDAGGMWAWFDGNTALELEGTRKQVCIALGNFLLSQVKGLSYNEALSFFGLDEED